MAAEHPQGHTSFSLNPTQGEHARRRHDRYSPGLHHFAWRAETRDDVDRFHDMLKEFGAEILDAPADYPQYNSGLGYYAVFFADRDGLKLECAWRLTDRSPPLPHTKLSRTRAAFG